MATLPEVNVTRALTYFALNAVASQPSCHRPMKRSVTCIKNMGDSCRWPPGTDLYVLCIRTGRCRDGGPIPAFHTSQPLVQHVEAIYVQAYFVLRKAGSALINGLTSDQEKGHLYSCVLKRPQTQNRFESNVQEGELVRCCIRCNLVAG